MNRSDVHALHRLQEVTALWSGLRAAEKLHNEASNKLLQQLAAVEASASIKVHVAAAAAANTLQQKLVELEDRWRAALEAAEAAAVHRHQVCMPDGRQDRAAGRSI